MIHFYPLESVQLGVILEISKLLVRAVSEFSHQKVFRPTFSCNCVPELHSTPTDYLHSYKSRPLIGRSTFLKL